MKILTTPWKDDFLDLVSQAKTSIKITSPFVKGNICNEMLNAKNKSSRIDLITSFKLGNIHSGSLDISALEMIIDNDGIVKNYPSLHSKIYLFDEEKAIITSGNLTYGGMLKNYEYGIYLDERNVVKQISDDFNSIFSDEITGTVKKEDLKTVKGILEKIPKSVSPKLPGYKIETPEEDFDIIENSTEEILASLKKRRGEGNGWKFETFKYVNSLSSQIFTLDDIYQDKNHFEKLFPDNHTIEDKIRQQLQDLRDLGLIEFLGSGKYKKLWK